VGVFLASSLTVTGAAQDGDTAQDEAGDSISLSLGTEVASAYYFRGIPQENQGILHQPGLEIGFGLFEWESGPVQSLGLSVGTWNSFHHDRSSRSGGGANPWYESDLYVGASLGLAGGLEFGATYTYLYGPNAAGLFAEELAFSLSFDESVLLGDALGGLSLGPSVTLVQEVAGGSDGLGRAGDLGTYLEIGIEPAFDIDITDDFAISLSAPLTVGLDVDDYYETTTGEDSLFGFFQAALAVSVPLPFIPKRLGSWSLGGSVNLLVLGEPAQDIGAIDFGVDSGDDVEFYVSGGLTIEH